MSALSALTHIEFFLAAEQDMSDASILERVIVFSWIFLAVTGGFNGIYICFHGIRRLDPYFSTKHNVEWESHSPFDSFCRMHRYSFQYSFGLKRPAIGNGIAVWLFFYLH